MDQVKAQYDKLKRQISRLKAEPDKGAVDDAAFASYKEKFTDALGNDLNTSGAITVLYDVLKADITPATKLNLIDSFDEVLALDLTKEAVTETAVDDELSKYVEQKLAERKEAKKNKDFATADAIRDELQSKGIVIKDTREGTTWEKV